MPSRPAAAGTRRAAAGSIGLAPSGCPSLPFVAELPRAALTSSRFKSGLKVTFHISIEGDPKSLKMEFPFPGRHDARQLADALARQ
jgi:hypothetical protein